MHFALMSFDDRPEPAKRLQIAREARGIATPKEAATRFGWVYETYIQHEQGIRGISRAAGRYAKAFRVSEGWLLTGEGKGPDDADAPGERLIPIVGLAGAGPDGSVLFAEGDGNFGEVVAPLDISETAEALEVRGDSMHGLANDGWLIFYDEKTEPSPDHMGEPCVCWLGTGRVLVKVPQPTKEPGLYNLESVNAPTMRDVPVAAMALVTDIKTRKAAQKYIRRNPNVNIEDLIVSR
jgi:hypothetical protein